VKPKDSPAKTGPHTPAEKSPGGHDPISPLMRFFFIRPVFAILLTFLLVASGLMAYQSIVKEAAPDLAIPFSFVFLSSVFLKSFSSILGLSLGVGFLLMGYFCL